MTKEEEIEWVKLFKRESELLIVYQVPMGRIYYTEILGINFQPKNLKHEGWFYYIDKKDLIQEYLALKKQYETHLEFLAELAQKMEKNGEYTIQKLDELTDSIETKPIDELKQVFVQCNELFYRYMPFVWVIFTVEKMLTDLTKRMLQERFHNASDEEIGAYFNKLISVPFKESAAIIEQKQILACASLLKSQGEISPEVEKEIARLFAEYSWTGTMRVGWTYLKDSYSMDHYTDLITALALGNPTKELEDMERKSIAITNDFQSFIQSAGIDSQVTSLSNLLRRFIFLRTFRGEVVSKAMIRLRTVLEEIALRLNLRLEDIVYFTPEEIVLALSSGQFPAFEKRKYGYKLLILDGAPQITDEVSTTKVDFGGIQMLKGEGIVEGLVSGKVRQLSKKEDIGKFLEDEILVTQMTSPDMLPAIMKAAAIVTDEGGLTCHAALISRELQIPCVISTEIATKVFRDGDIVTVNSKDGVVRKGE